MTVDFRHVVAELFLHVCAHLSFFICYIVEVNLTEGARSILLELCLLGLDGNLANVLCVLHKHFVDIVCRVGTHNRFFIISSCKKFNLCQCFLIIVDQKLVLPRGNDQQVLLQQLIHQDGTHFL